MEELFQKRSNTRLNLSRREILFNRNTVLHKKVCFLFNTAHLLHKKHMWCHSCSGSLGATPIEESPAPNRGTPRHIATVAHALQTTVLAILFPLSACSISPGQTLQSREEIVIFVYKTDHIWKSHLSHKNIYKQ